MPAIRRALDARRWAAAVPLLTLLCRGAVGATGCTPAPVATTTSTSQCVKAVKGTPKAKAKVSVVLPAAAAAVAAPTWKGVLDPLPGGGWKYISDGPADNPSAVYASSHSILHNGNVVTAWMRWEFARAQAEVYPLHYLSAVTREELDCDARAYRRTAVVYYTRNNLQEKGPSFTALNDDTTWKQAIPGSEPDAMLNWGCTLPVEPEHSPAPAKAAKAAKAAAAPKAQLPTGSASSAPAASASGTDVHTAR
ncbi:MAG TPA: surface-adhesin E family protein [Steroidobacteraceae bacterium]